MIIQSNQIQSFGVGQRTLAHMVHSVRPPAPRRPTPGPRSVLPGGDGTELLPRPMIDRLHDASAQLPQLTHGGKAVGHQ